MASFCSGRLSRWPSSSPAETPQDFTPPHPRHPPAPQLDSSCALFCPWLLGASDSSAQFVWHPPKSYYGGPLRSGNSDLAGPSSDHFPVGSDYFPHPCGALAFEVWVKMHRENHGRRNASYSPGTRTPQIGPTSQTGMRQLLGMRGSLA